MVSLYKLLSILAGTVFGQFDNINPLEEREESPK